jgi:PAS domain S-box-containing protein
MPVVNNYLVRQPIFDGNLQVYAYELPATPAGLKQSYILRECLLMEMNDENYRLLIDNLPAVEGKAVDVLWATDLAYKYTYLSPEVEEQIGFNAEDLLGSSALTTLTPETIKKTAEAFMEAVSVEVYEDSWPNPFVTLNLEHSHRDGSPVWVTVNMAFTRDNEGKANGIIGVSRTTKMRGHTGPTGSAY